MRLPLLSRDVIGVGIFSEVKKASGEYQWAKGKLNKVLFDTGCSGMTYLPYSTVGVLGFLLQQRSDDWQVKKKLGVQNIFVNEIIFFIRTCFFLSSENST